MKKLQKTTLAIAATVIVGLFAFKPSSKQVDPTKPQLTLIADVKNEQILFVVQDQAIADTLRFKDEHNIERDLERTFNVSPRKFMNWFPYDEFYITKQYNEYTINTVPSVTIKYDQAANTVHYNGMRYKIKDPRFKDLHEMATKLDQGNPVRFIIQK